jgi:hypothetical protein
MPDAIKSKEEKLILVSFPAHSSRLIAESSLDWVKRMAHVVLPKPLGLTCHQPLNIRPAVTADKALIANWWRTSLKPPATQPRQPHTAQIRKLCADPIQHGIQPGCTGAVSGRPPGLPQRFIEVRPLQWRAGFLDRSMTHPSVRSRRR